jgi:1-phosphofructokinase
VVFIFYTCTLNPAIDLVVESDDLLPDIVNRTNSEDYQANGKTINISIMLKKMGIDNTALGFIGGFTGQYIESELKRLGISTDFTEIDGITRVNTFVRTKEQEFKIVNKGPAVSREKHEEMLGKISAIPNGSYLFVSGSLPQGLSDEIYVDISRIAARKDLKLILDISSKRLLDCLAYQPYLIKPNREELASFFGREALTEEEVLSLGQELIERGAQRVLVSLGEEGSIFLTQKEMLRVNSPAGKVVNTACAGDTLLAAFVGKLFLEGDLKEALRFGSAAGSGTAFSTGLVELEFLPALLEEVRAYEIEKSMR